MRLQGRVKFRANATITFDSFYQGAGAVREITQAGLFPANARYLDEQDAKFYGAGDGSKSVLLLGFESADHPVDAWLERGIEICKDHGGSVETKTGSGGDALQSSRSGAQGNWRKQFRYLPRMMHTRAAMGVVSFTFETAYTWDKFESIDTEVIRRLKRHRKRSQAAVLFVGASHSSTRMARRHIIQLLRLQITAGVWKIIRHFQM